MHFSAIGNGTGATVDVTFESRPMDKCILNETTLFCMNSKNFRRWCLSVHTKLIKSVTHLIIDEWENQTFRTAQISKFSNLREFIIETGNITEIIGDFPSLKRLRVINQILKRAQMYKLSINELKFPEN